MPFDMGWSDQWVVKLGIAGDADGAARRSAPATTTGRCRSTRDRAFENLVFPAVSEHHFTAGAGYAFSDRLAANVTGVYSLNAKVYGANAAPPPPMGGTGQGIASYSTEMSQFEVDFTLCYRF